MSVAVKMSAAELNEVVARQTLAAHQRWREAWQAGPRPKPESAPRPTVGQGAPDLLLDGLDGRPHRLSEAWERQPVLVIFLRHFGCSCTWRRLDALANDSERVLGLGAGIVLVSQAEPERSAAFAEHRGIGFQMLCDPHRAAYRAYGLGDGSLDQIVYREMNVAEGLEMADRFRAQGRYLVDSPWQLAGEFIVEPGGLVKFAHRYAHCNDFPDPLTIFKFLGATKM
jgi:peroxiredoxin